jgi:hypothetical protein
MSDKTLVRIVTTLGIMVLVVCGIRLLAGTWQRISCGADPGVATVLSAQHLGAAPSLGECITIAWQQSSADSSSQSDAPVTSVTDDLSVVTEQYVAPGDTEGCRAYATVSGSFDPSTYDECMSSGAP